MKTTWELELVPENAEKIDAVNRILLGEVYTQQSTASSTDSGITTVSGDEETAATPTVSLGQLKAAAKAAKEEHGVEFCNAAIANLGVTVGKQIGANLKKLDESQYSDAIAAFEAGPQESDDDGLGDDDDDGLGDDDTPAEVDPDVVKTALKAMSKAKGRDAAKALMTDNGVSNLAEISNASQETLTAILKGTA